VLERVGALSNTLTRLRPESIWQLYTTLPGLLTLTTLEVAQRLTGLAAATGLNTQGVLQYCCTFRPFAFMTPDTVMSRVSLLAKVARLESGAAAVVVMQQHPQLWGISSKLLAPRWGGREGVAALHSTSRPAMCQRGACRGQPAHAWALV
jgi:hypothetical protein